MTYTIEPIAVIHNNYKDKFGIPRQSGLLERNVSTIVFEPKYRDENSLRGLDGFSHLWLLWIFDNNNSDKSWSPTVRPPRLGGNKRMGVFATRSPYHPNRIGLSCVKIKAIEKTSKNGCIISVTGADLMDGTPIIDIKPYLAFSDAHTDAVCGFSKEVFSHSLNVFCNIKTEIPEDALGQIIEILKQDPRPSYQNDPDRVYGMNYGGYEIKFNVRDNDLFILSIERK